MRSLIAWLKPGNCCSLGGLSPRAPELRAAGSADVMSGRSGTSQALGISTYLDGGLSNETAGTLLPSYVSAILTKSCTFLSELN